MIEREKGFDARCLKFTLAFERGGEMNRGNLWAFVLMLVSSVLYGLDGNIVKWIGVEDAILNSGLRALGATIFASVFLLNAKRRMPRFRGDNFFVGAVVSSVLCCFAFIFAIRHVKVGTALMLFHAAILWLTIIKWVVGEAIDRVDRRAGYGVFLGILVLCFQREIAQEFRSILVGEYSGYRHILGFVSGIFAGMAFAGHLYLSEKAGSKSKEDAWAMRDIKAE